MNTVNVVVVFLLWLATVGLVIKGSLLVYARASERLRAMGADAAKAEVAVAAAEVSLARQHAVLHESDPLVREFAVLQQGRPQEQRSGHEPRNGADRRSAPEGKHWFERRKDTETAKAWRQARCRRIRTNSWDSVGDRRGAHRDGSRRRSDEEINLRGRRKKNRRSA